MIEWEISFDNIHNIPEFLNLFSTFQPFWTFNALKVQNASKKFACFLLYQMI